MTKKLDQKDKKIDMKTGREKFLESQLKHKKPITPKTTVKQKPPQKPPANKSQVTVKPSVYTQADEIERILIAELREHLGCERNQIIEDLHKAPTKEDSSHRKLRVTLGCDLSLAPDGSITIDSKVEWVQSLKRHGETLTETWRPNEPNLPGLDKKDPPKVDSTEGK